MNTLLSRRGVAQRLGVETLWNMEVSVTKETNKGSARVSEKGAVLIEKRITRLPKPFQQLYAVEQQIHDGGEQCRIKRVRSLTDGQTYVVKVQLKSKIRGRNEALFRRMTERMMNLPESPNVIKVFACYEDDKYYYTLLESLHGGDLFDFFRVLTSDTLEPEVVENEVRKVIS